MWRTRSLSLVLCSGTVVKVSATPVGVSCAEIRVPGTSTGHGESVGLVLAVVALERVPGEESLAPPECAQAKAVTATNDKTARFIIIGRT
jgi:hypothetical protein